MSHVIHKGHILLINPWIYDFAAFNLWTEPLGLLTISAALRDNGYRVTLVDCLAPGPWAPRVRPNGSGKLAKVVLPKPVAVAFVPRRYGRYGLPLEEFDAWLAAISTPDLVLVSSGMTYWYEGVVEAIRRVRARYGAVPLALGGVYATLCPAHAKRHSGADWVCAGPGVVEALSLADGVCGHNSEPERYADPRSWPAPAHGMVRRPYAAVTTSWGCPYRCTYCASHRLQAAFVQRQPAAVVAEIAACAAAGIGDVAFYDDALLVSAEQHLVPILKGVLARGLGVRFHTPNGLHAGWITPELAVLMRRAGFATVRVSLETVDAVRQQLTGGKVSTPAFERAIANLLAAGFGSEELGAYVLAGLPGQPPSEVEETIRSVQGLGIPAKLALFSPIPGTPDGDQALAGDADPLLHNDTVYPYLKEGHYAAELQRLKELAKRSGSTTGR